MAETRAVAEKAFDFFLEAYGPKYDKAAACLAKDRDVLLAYPVASPTAWWMSSGDALASTTNSGLPSFMRIASSIPDPLPDLLAVFSASARFLLALYSVCRY